MFEREYIIYSYYNLNKQLKLQIIIAIHVFMNN